VAVVDAKLRKAARYLHDAAPGAPPEGSTPNAIALTSDGKRLLVAEADGLRLLRRQEDSLARIRRFFVQCPLPSSFLRSRI
jgi:hypothetical protein